MNKHTERHTPYHITDLQSGMFRVTGNTEGDYLDFRQGSGNTIEIYDIAVSSERRRGVGRRMVEILFNSLMDDIKIVWAITRADNMIAQHFYEGLGFRVVGVLREFYNVECAQVDAIMYGRSHRGPV